MSAGYSGTPLIQKLGIKPGHRVLFVGAPGELDELLGPLPEDTRRFQRASRDLDYVHLFVERELELRRRFSRLADCLKPAGMLWISWPKKSSGVPSDLDGNVVRRIGLSSGLVDVKVCAVNEVWSALKFMIRVANRVGR